MDELKFKTIAASLAMFGASALSADAASVVYNNNGGNGVLCSFGSSCSIVLSGSDAAAGATLTLGIDQGAAATDNTLFEFAPHAFGLGLGFIEDSGDPTLSLFSAAITLSVDRDLTWTGGSFSSVQTNNPVVIGSETTPAVNITGAGLNATVFEDETNFNVRPGQTSSSAGFVPQSFSLLGQGIDFVAGETYTLAFRDYAIAGQGNEAFVQFNSMDFVTTASIPLPATAWMMIGALGFLGWRKYRTA